MDEKTCPECGEVIRGRSDKKFCCDLCRNNYNNRLVSDTTNFIRNINNILRRNRRILCSLVVDETAKAPKRKLLDLGFDFQYHTNTITTRKGSTYYFCYEFGYLKMDNDFLFLVKRKEVG